MAETAKRSDERRNIKEIEKKTSSRARAEPSSFGARSTAAIASCPITHDSRNKGEKHFVIFPHPHKICLNKVIHPKCSEIQKVFRVAKNYTNFGIF